MKVKCSVLDRFLKWFESSLNTLLEQKLQWKLVLVNDLLKSKGTIANCMIDGLVFRLGPLRNNFCVATEH